MYLDVLLLISPLRFCLAKVVSCDECQPEWKNRDKTFLTGNEKPILEIVLTLKIFVRTRVYFDSNQGK